MIQRLPVRSGMASLLVGLALVVLSLPGLAWAAIDFPPLTGRVVDQADLLTPEQEASLTAKLQGLENQTGDQVVVVTLTSLQDQDIADYGYQLGRHWGIGQAENDSGALLIVAPNERRVRIEVGYGLEGVLTDAWSGLLIQNRILPAFREGDYAGGIITGTDALIGQLTLDPAEAAARAAEAKKQVEASQKGGLPIIPIIVFGFIFFFIFVPALTSGRGGRRRRSGAADALGNIAIWAASEALRNRGGGGWGSGGGGFSGGGGGFGGGGASGGW